VKNYATDLDTVLLDLKQALAESQACYQVYADVRQTTSPKIEVGDSVFVLAKFIRTTRPSKKLSEHYLGPFQVMGKPSTHSYQVRLPHHLYAVHPVFYILQLEPANTSQIPNCVNPPPPPSLSMANSSMRSPKCLIPNLIAAKNPPFYTMSNGLVTKVLTKSSLGSAH